MTLLLGLTCALLGCQKSPFPPFENAANIVIDGVKIKPAEYLDRYCLGKPGGEENQYCKAAIEQNTQDFMRPRTRQQSKTQTTGELSFK